MDAFWEWWPDLYKDLHTFRITGGEPLLGWQRSYEELLSHPGLEDIRNITFETNGTQTLQPKFIDFLQDWTDVPGHELTFSVSPKLSCSGENHEEAIKPEVIRQYQETGFVYLKFVVASEDDVQEAQEAVKEYKQGGFNGPVYLMPVGGVESVYSMNAKNVALAAMKLGYRYSDRLQVPLFKNEWGT